MGLLRRVQRMVNASINDLVDRAEDPVKMIKQLVREMEQSVVETQEATAAAMANLKQLQKRQVQNRAEGEKWLTNARLALGRGDEELTRQALRRRKIHTDLEGSYVEQIATQENTVATLKTALAALRAKLDEARARSKVLVSKAQQTKAQDEVRRIASRAPDTSAFAEFERMAERIDERELAVVAAIELDVDTLEAKFEKQEEDAEIEAELVALKEAMAQEPAAPAS